MDVTAYVPLLNLPTDALNILPWTGVVNGPTGSMPQSLWDWLVDLGYAILNGMVAAGQLIYGGLVAMGNFFIALGEAIVDWGMEAIGTYQEALQVIQAAFEQVLEVLMSFVELLKAAILKFVQSFYDAMSNLWEALAGEFIGSLQYSASQAVEEYGVKGYISSPTGNRLLSAFQSRFTWILLGVTTAIMVGYTAYLIATAGLGTLIGLVGGTIASTLIFHVFGLGLLSFDSNVPIPDDWSPTSLIGNYVEWLTDSGWVEHSDEGLMIALLGALFAIGATGLSLLAIGLHQPGPLVGDATGWGLYLGIWSIALALSSGIGGRVGRALALIGGFIGFMSLILTLVGSVVDKLAYWPLNVAAALLGGTGAFLGVSYGL